MLENCSESIIESFLRQCCSPILYLSAADSAQCYIKSIPVLKDSYICDLADCFLLATPYTPFVQLLSQIKPDETMIKRAVYPLHQDAFRGYFDTGKAYSRPDVIIPSELDYEKQRMRENIVSLFTMTCKKVLIILNAQRLSPESLKIIDIFESKNIKNKIILCFNEAEGRENTVTGETYRLLRFNHNFYEITDRNSAGLTILPMQKLRDYLVSISFDQLAKIIWNMRYFLSLGEAFEIINTVIPHIQMVAHNDTDIRVLYLEAGIINFYIGNPDKSLFYFETLTDMYCDDYAGKRALYFSSQVLFQKNDFEAANKYALMLYQRTDENDEHSLNTLAAAMHHIIQVSISRDVTIDDYRRFQNLLQSKNLPNNTIYTLLYIPYHLMQSKEITQHINKTIDDVICIAEKLNNEIAISSAYHWKGLLSSSMGNKNEAFIWYTKSNEIRCRVGDIQNVIKMRNGLSYEKMLSGDYVTAYDLINDSLPRVYEVNDYTETILTLYNLGRILFFGRNFRTALDIFSQTLSMMNLFKIKELLYFTIDDIVLFTALVQCINQDTMRAHFTYERLCSNDVSLSASSKPLLDLLGTLLDCASGNIQDSLIQFEKLYQNLVKTFPHLKNYLPFAYFEYAVVLDRQGFKKESLQIYEDGLAFAVQNEMLSYTLVDFPTTADVYRNYSVFFSQLKLDFLHVEERAEKDTLVNNLHKQIRDTRFLNKIFDLSANYPIKEEFVHHCALTICEYFLCDSVYIAEKSGTEWISLTSYSSNGLPIDTIPDCDAIVSKYRGIDFFHYSATENVVFCNMEKFEFTGVAVLSLNVNERLSAEDLNLLRLALASLQSQLTMFKQNENLLRLSSTDQLTSLNNRHALEEKIDKDSEMIRRYFRRDKIIFQVTITFIDLDNFKYYNDSFGHEAGDFMIASFGRLLVQQYRRIDFVARFGGDEFIIIMPATPSDGALLAAERLQTVLAEECYFIPQLERMLGHKVAIPDDKKLNFCAGISSNSEQNDIDNLEDVINRADKALYYAKYSGKHQIILWSEIEDCDLLKLEQVKSSEE